MNNPNWPHSGNIAEFSYAMSQQAYETNWQLITKDPYAKFGRAFSINLLGHRAA